MDQLDDFELPVENCPGAEGDGIKIVMRPYSQVMSQWRPRHWEWRAPAARMRCAMPWGSCANPNAMKKTLETWPKSAASRENSPLKSGATIPFAIQKTKSING